MNELMDLELIDCGNEDIRCYEVLSLMGEYVDGELSEDVAISVHDHILHCDECSKLEDDYRRTIELARELGDKPIPGDVRNRLHKALNQRLGLNLPVEQE